MHNSTTEENIVAAWTPDLFGPIFKKNSLTLKEALNLRNVGEQIHLMATFVPDEVIHEVNLSEKNIRSFQAVLLLLDISGFSMLVKKYIYDENKDSLALTTVLNNYIHIAIREIYCSEGDILKFSAQALLAVWKVRDGEFMFNVVQKVITRAIRIQNSIAALKNNGISKVNIVISAGDVIFSIIGNNEARHFVIFGQPIVELKRAKRVSLSNDLVVSSSAWQHCIPSQYEYVIKDPYNVKIIKMLNHSDAKSTPMLPKNCLNIERKSMINAKPSSYKTDVLSTDETFYLETKFANLKKKVPSTISAIAAINPNFGTQLKSYLMKPVIQQIEKGQLLEFLTEIRQITTVSLDIIPNKYSNDELILLVDKCYLLLQNIVMQYIGCINTVNLYDKNILFCMIFGIRTYNNKDEIGKTCKNGIAYATQALQAIKSITEVQGVFIGIATGIVYCGVLGNVIRKYYAVIGPSVNRAIDIMNISYNKISCDYDTVLHSRLSKDQFRSRGVRTLWRSEKCHVYEYVGEMLEEKDSDVTSSLDYCYPILGRQQELEDFNDVLDEVGVADRNYSGLLIEGSERSGKSRLLDAFVTSVCNRQIRPIKLSLHMTYSTKAYAVIHHLILQILKAEDCDTIEEREKVLLDRLGDILALEDFCYLNSLMRVRFSLSDTYCADSDWQRDKKAISIFDMILKQPKTKICILLDDVQHMDSTSWQFMSQVLNNDNIVIAMTMLKTNSLDDLSHVEKGIRENKWLMKRTLLGLDLDLLPAFACQFLNVLGIPKRLSRTLRKREDGHIGWCEAFLMLILRDNAIDFIRITPREARQRNIVFPNGPLITKLPVSLTPEELAPPLPWSHRDYLDVCVTNKRYSKISEIDTDIKGLISEIYNRMNPYEQNFITCAATLGKVFKRSVLQNVMLNAIPPHTIRTVSEMLRIRILECASLQRQDFHSEEFVLCIPKKRRTFSDMHHLVSCNCRLSEIIIDDSSSIDAYCKMLEFKINLFCKMMYELQSNKEKQEHHARAARIYDLDAQKCSSCGGGTFLRVATDISEIEDRIESPRASLIRRKTILENRNNKSFLRRSTLSMGGIVLPKRQESLVHRISIMPTYLDDEEDKESIAKDEEIKENQTNELLGFWRRFTTLPEIVKEPPDPNYLEKFTHIDLRNCQCDVIISCLFWRLHEHIENSGKIYKMVEFLMEYSAGLIQIAQPSYAIVLLTIAIEKNEAARIDEWTNDNAKDNITNKGIILSLMGDAYSALGNYVEAKKYYIAAITLRGIPVRKNKAICYSMMASKVYCKLQSFPFRTANKISGQIAGRKLELASFMRRFCIVLMMEDKMKAAKLFALRSFKLGFSGVGNFLEKGKIYLAAIQILRRTRNIELIRCIERSMLSVIKIKTSWNDAEEMAMLANVYFIMYQIRALKGELEETISIGNKILKISRTLHLNNLILFTMPSLIQIMLWTKRINKAIDLMRELYFLAEEDMDLSAKTWYYALSLEFILDAGVALESYETCLNYYKKCLVHRSNSFVRRDPQSLCRLLTCLWIYELRTGYTLTNTVAYRAEEYMKDINWHDFSKISSCSKGLECYLLILSRCVNMKYSDELLDLIEDVYKIIKCLDNISSYAVVVKPYLYLLIAYFNIIRGRKSVARFYLYRAQKLATLQGNKLIIAWIMQNKRTWRKKSYNNMARYWLEYTGTTDIVAWQYIHDFSIDVWSTILYPLPIPISHL